MVIAIPLASGRLCDHFGHCEEFLLVTVDKSNREVTGSRSLDPPKHEPGVLPAWLSKMGCDLIIAGGMGQRAISLFNKSGVEVIVGVPSGQPEDVILAYLNDTLESGVNLCDH